jgi:hypothetical protein
MRCPISTEPATTDQSEPFTALSSVRDRPIANAGQLKPGQSGNPAGRPCGARNKATLTIAALLELDLADGKAADDVLASLAATVRAMAEGTISPLEAADVAEVLEGQRRAIETHDLERRLRRLEEVADFAPNEGAERLVLPDAVLDEPYEPPQAAAFRAAP